MNLANRLTFFRVILAPVFFIIYLIPRFFPSLSAENMRWIVPALWIIFLVSEITDYFDGLAARKLSMTSDFGKLFDPFADTLMQITCFLCFIIDGIFPAWAAILLLLLIYREFSILFIRNLMLKKGVTLGARMSGKIKTVTCIIAAGVTLLAVSLERLGIYNNILPYVKTTALVIFAVSVLLAVISFFEYLSIYQKTEKNDD